MGSQPRLEAIRSAWARVALAGASIKLLLLAVGLAVSTAGAIAQQAAGSTGARTVQGYWFEPGHGMVIKGAQPFANPTGCTHANTIWVLSTNPEYKQIVAAVIHAKASNMPVIAWVVSCRTVWGGESTPVVHALGVDWY
jgi:hypothetical protein